jgi:CheY-like chemotaxis protein
MTAEQHKKRYFLIVDSNIDDRFRTSLLLQQFGYNICTAHTAEEAVEFTCVAPPAAIIAEGGQVGAALLSRLQKTPCFSDVPVVLLSAAPEQVRSEACAAVLVKPVDPEAFYRAIQAIVEKTPRRNIRTATYLAAKLDDGSGSEGYVTVLSEYGMFFRTLEPRPVQTRLKVFFDIKGRTIRLEAVVLYCYSFDEGPFKEPGLGMKFEKINAEDRALIKAFILEQVENGITRKEP